MSFTMVTKRRLLASLIAVVLLLVSAWALYFVHTKSTLEKKPLYWIDPMEPDVHYPGPGKSHMGMDVIPVYDGQNKQDPNTITISPTIVKNLGVHTALVVKGNLNRTIETVGFVEPNEKYISNIHAYAEGWISNLAVKEEGDTVRQGQLLLQLYSPVIIKAQQEYLSALDSKDNTSIETSYNTLRSFNIPETLIDEVKQKHTIDKFINIFSPQNGIVTELKVQEGAFVTPENEIMSLASLSLICVMAHLFEPQASSVYVGEHVQATLSPFPGKIFKGTVEYIYPEIDPITRSLRVRFVFDNQDKLLKPNMIAKVTLLDVPKTDILIIPIEALIRTSHGNRVIVAKAENRFEARNVTTGMESGEDVEVLNGLKEGEKVVTSGQFLIDSQISLQEPQEDN